MNRQRLSFLCVACCMLTLTGCASHGRPPRALPAEKRAAIQSHAFNASPDTVWQVTLDVLQDAGWQLGDLDKTNQIIRAASQKEPNLIGPEDDWRKPNDKYMKRLKKEAKKAAKHHVPYPEWSRWTDVTVRLEPGDAAQTQMRLAITKHGTLASGAKAKKAYAKKSTPIVGQEQSVMVDDAKVYRDLFDKIERAIAARQGTQPPKKR